MNWYHVHLVLIQQTAIFVLVALSFQVVLRSGVFSFASIGFYGIGAYTAANLAKHGFPGVANIVLVTIAGFVLGYLLSFPLIRLRGLYLGMVTFAFDQIIGVVANNAGKLTGGPIGLYGIPLDVNTGELLAAAVIAIVLVSQLERRSLGRGIEALRTDENLARSMGIEVVRQRNFLFAISAALGAAAGVLYVLAFSTIAPPSFGFDLIVSGLTMAVIGGVGSWLGAAIGAVIVVWFPDVFHFVGNYKSIVYGVLVILVICYEPNGLLGLGKRAGGWISRSRRPRPVAPTDTDAADPSTVRVGDADGQNPAPPPLATVPKGST